jgi:hypothetical protein
MDDKRQAFHEAGHAVSGHVLGLAPKHASAKSDEEAAGRVVIPEALEILEAWGKRGICWRSVNNAYRCRILCAMAGREAEEEFLGVRRDRRDAQDIHVIQSTLENLLEDLSLTNCNSSLLEARMRRATRSFVRRHRAAIERVAWTLMSRDLSCEEIADLVGETEEHFYTQKMRAAETLELRRVLGWS